MKAAQPVVTGAHAFPGVAANFNQVFAVQAGVPLDAALQHVSTLLDTALRTSMDCAMESDSSRPWSAVYMLEMALAVLNASIDGMDAAERGSPVRQNIVPLKGVQS